VGRHFPNWLKAYMSYTYASESPDDFHFWTGVSTIAGALRRRVWIPMNSFDWIPNFYIILVGPPGVAAKSTTIGVGMDLLREVPGIKFGSESGTWQKMAIKLQESTEYVDYIDRYGMQQTAPMSCLTIPVSELGTFLKMSDDAYSSALIALWDGARVFSHDTISGGNTEVKFPWLNVIAATTPAWLRANFPEHAIGGGLTSRIIFVYGEQKRKLVAYPDEVTPSREYLNFRAQLIEDLTQISELKGEYTMDPDAREWGREWYETHWSNRPAHMASDRYGGYIARKQTHIHKLAIVIAAAQRNELVIEKADLETANALTTKIEADMIRVFESVGVVDEARYRHEILQFVAAHKWLDTQTLWKLCMNIIPQREFNIAVRDAVQNGILRVTERDGIKGVELATAPSSAQ
jgi:hypothetical protein